MLDLYMSHGRRDPAEEMPDWGFDGPRLSNVIGIHETYRTTLRVIFADAESAKQAQRATGWDSWDTCELEAQIASDMLACDHRGDRAYFGDWGLIEPESQRHARAAKQRALRAALRFVEGFEGDELQEGIDGPDGLLALLRSAAGPDPVALARPAPVTAPAAAAVRIGRDPIAELDPELRAWLVEEMGMEAEMTGGGCYVLRHQGPGGWHMWVSGFDGDLPQPNWWGVGVYSPADASEAVWYEGHADAPDSDINEPSKLTLRQAVAAACSIMVEVREAE